MIQFLLDIMLLPLLLIMLMGLIGVGISVAMLASLGSLFPGGHFFDLVGFTPSSWIGLMISVPVMSGAAGWVPAFLGARRAPAEVLKND